MDTEIQKLREIAENTQSNYMLGDIEARLGHIETELQTTNEFLRDIVAALNER